MALFHVELHGNKGTVELIAGEYENTKGPARTFSPLHLSNTRLNTNAEVKFNFPAEWNTGILVVEGKANINDSEVHQDHFVLFENAGERISIKAVEPSILLVMSAEPINEPIAQYGPFLMNTWEEVEQAITDVSRGKFGTLE